MKCSAQITIEADADMQHKLQQLFSAEDKVLSNNRASYTIQMRNDECLFIIEAQDGVALRAILSSISKTLSVFEKTIFLLGETNDE
jgi:tRNA threonylcarbamoyladenosine modification (KEOPS) complex  Pcc1 subunit